MKARTMWVTVALVAILVLVVGGSGAISAQRMPQSTTGSKFVYQGRLTDKSGNPLDGTFPMLFRIYDSETGPIYYWDSGVMSVGVDNGLFRVELPAYHPIFNGEEGWLAIWVDGEWLSPRQELVPVPYALSLRPGAEIDGETQTGWGLSIDWQHPNATGGAMWGSSATSVGIRGESPGGYGLWGYSNTNWAVKAEANTGSAGEFTSNEGYGIRAETAGTDHWDYAGWFTSNRGIGVYAQGQNNIGLKAESGNVSTMNQGCGLIGVVGLGQELGMLGVSEAGDGVRGQSDDADGVEGYSFSMNGVYGESENWVGVRGKTNAAMGIGVVGLKPDHVPEDLPSGFWRPAGLFYGGNGVIGMSKTDGGYAMMGYNMSPGGGYAGVFWSDVGDGVWIYTPPGTQGLTLSGGGSLTVSDGGNLVVSGGGTKNAAAETSEGTRLLYTEESTEVWFSDYGFGQLQDGQVVIRIDPLYAQTVNLEEPYHVFVQVYGDAEVYVTSRTPTQFEVLLREGDAGVEFSYRIVAKRLGHETDRLEPAPEVGGAGGSVPGQGLQGEAGGLP